ncbi:MAG: hypothetical protein WCG66_10755, partial [bacterium]
LDFGFWILDFGFWILDFGFWVGEKPNGEFWMLNGGLKTMLDFGCWILDGIQHSAFSIQHLKFSFGVRDFRRWF